ncbi:hypothetical protein RCOM_1912900, partial [Ricinus communis]
APRKSTSSERLPSKEDNKTQLSAKSSKEENRNLISTKKVTANGNSDDQEKLNKPKTSIGKKLSGDHASNGLLGNLVKVPINGRKLTEGSVSWNSLPSSLAKLGKVKPLWCCLYEYLVSFFFLGRWGPVPGIY